MIMLSSFTQALVQLHWLCFFFFFRFTLWWIFSAFVYETLFFFFRVWYIVFARFLGLYLSKYWICLNAYIFTGFFDVTHDEASSLDICQHHRDRMGIYWGGRCKNCQVPPEVAHHKSAAKKGDRSLVKDQSQYIKKITGKLIPVGSGMKVSYFFNKQVFAFPEQ